LSRALRKIIPLIELFFLTWAVKRDIIVSKEVIICELSS
jgi:hypothetical protein